MSHELRTPLNSLLILAETLLDNPEGNLTFKQLEFAQTIYASGSDLLALINDILDMAKIESGTMAVDVQTVSFRELRDYVERTFRPVADNKDLQFFIDLSRDLPDGVRTDFKRLQQVLRNLLSNAFKFTEAGKVSLEIRPATAPWIAGHEKFNRAGLVVAFAVSDTGLGIPADKLKVIFEPFQQADMSTARRYGGTGLGLSISREIARMLGGEIHVESVVGEGSTFVLYLPVNFSEAPARPKTAPLPSIKTEPFYSLMSEEAPDLEEMAVGGDRDVRRGDNFVLIVEHDRKFANILLDTAHQNGFKALTSPSGETALRVARELKPRAITLDLKLPDMDGWVVLDRLKHDSHSPHSGPSDICR